MVWNRLNCTMLSVALGNRNNKYIETFIFNSNNTYSTYKQGMSDSFTNTMGPSFSIQMRYFSTYASYIKGVPLLRICIKSSRLHSVRYILYIDITSASAYKRKRKMNRNKTRTCVIFSGYFWDPVRNT